MKNKDSDHRCSFFPPLLLALVIIVLPQLAKAANTAVLSGTKFHMLNTHTVYFDLNKPGNDRVQRYSAYYRPQLLTAAPMLKTAILNYGNHDTGQHFIPVSHLKHCHFLAADIELDQQHHTREWLVTTHHSCQPATGKTLWLLQAKTGQTPQVLMSEQANTLKISQNYHHGYRAITSGLSTRLTIKHRVHEANCKTNWRYNGRIYTSGSERIKIWGQPAVPGTAAYWHKINHVYPDLSEQLPVKCPRY